MTDTAIKETITAIIEKYAGDNTFWRFIDDFAATVGLDLRNGKIERIANLLGEGARRYEWLREFEPNHFARLTESNPENLKALVAIVDWAIVENLPVSHYSRVGTAVKGEEMSVFASVVAARTPVAVSQSAVASREDVEIALQLAGIDPDAVLSHQPKTANADELKALAVAAYENALGKVIKVSQYAIHDWITPSGDYALAVVRETGATEIGILENHEDGEISMRSTWSVEMLTGDHRGKSGFVHAPAFHSDGYFDPQWVRTTNHALNDDYRLAWLSEGDLIELVRLDCQDLEGKSVLVPSFSAFIGESNEQDTFAFDPPVKATVDPFNFNDFKSEYRLENEGPDNLVIDVYVDLTSDDERAANLRTLWTHGTSYYQDGRIEATGLTVVAPDLTEEVEVSGPKI